MYNPPLTDENFHVTLKVNTVHFFQSSGPHMEGAKTAYGEGDLSNLKSIITCKDTFAVQAVKNILHLYLNHNLKTSNLLALK
jgi:hypothetical protein